MKCRYSQAIIPVVLALLFVIFSSSLYAQYDVRIKIPITVSDSSSIGPTGPAWAKLYFGFAPEATYCWDNFKIYFTPCDSAYELELPPPPPFGVLDARWTDHHGVGISCIDQGLSTNLHHSESPHQRDTFKLRLQPIATVYPLMLSWPDSLSNFFDSLRLRYTDYFGVVHVIDMFTQTSVQIASSDYTGGYIYSYGLKGGSQTTPTTPVQTQPVTGDTGISTSATLSWNSVTPSTNVSYLVQLSQDSLFTTYMPTRETPNLYIEFTDLELSTKYYWRVKAMSSLAGCYQHTPFSFVTASQVNTVTVRQEGNGVISGTSVIATGSSPLFTFAPEIGYYIDSIFVDGVYAGNASSYTFSTITSNHILRVKFTIYTYTLNTTVTHGTITKNNPDPRLYDYGTVVQLTAVADSGYVFVNWSGDASGTTNPLSVTMNGDKTIQANFMDQRDVVAYRTATMEQWALAKDGNGKYKSIKKAFDKVLFKFNLIADASGILLLDFGGTSSLGAILRGTDTLSTFEEVKKFKDTLLVTLGDVVQIEGVGLKGKLMKVKYAWGVKGKLTSVSSYLVNKLGLPLPNLVNVGEEMFKQNAFPNGFLVGIPQGKKKAHSVLHKKYGDVQKSLIKVTRSSALLHTNGPRCLDSIGNKAMTSQLMCMPPDKQNNNLFAEQLVLKLNITASATVKFPVGLGELVYFDNSDSGNPFNGKLVRDIAKDADTMLTCLPLVSTSGATLADLYDVIEHINGEFADSTIDTISFGTKTKLNGVKQLINATYLHHPDGFVAQTMLLSDQLDANTPDRYELEQNYPNPFNPTTTLSFVIGHSSLVSLKLYDVLGREVATLINNEALEGGSHQIVFDGANLPSGVYFYRLQAGEFSDTKKLMLMK